VPSSIGWIFPKVKQMSRQVGKVFPTSGKSVPVPNCIWAQKYFPPQGKSARIPHTASSHPALFSGRDHYPSAHQYELRAGDGNLGKGISLRAFRGLEGVLQRGEVRFIPLLSKANDQKHDA
jgi:hypothetical protein